MYAPVVARTRFQIPALGHGAVDGWAPPGFGVPFPRLTRTQGVVVYSGLGTTRLTENSWLIGWNTCDYAVEIETQ